MPQGKQIEADRRKEGKQVYAVYNKNNRSVLAFYIDRLNAERRAQVENRKLYQRGIYAGAFIVKATSR